MKKLLIIFISFFFLYSCTNAGKETTKIDKIITTSFLTGAYSKEFHELNLAGKGLKEIPNFKKYLTGSYIDDVWSINLQDNSIKKVDSKLFEYFPNLKEVNLSYNQIKGDVKINLPFLDVLLIHKNNISNINLSGSLLLTNLNLGYNAFKNLKGSVLPESIKNLELQHNNLDNLSGIEKLINLENLKLEFNNLEDNDMSVLKILKKLRYITVGENKLSKKLEDGFFKLNEKWSKEKK